MPMLAFFTAAVAGITAAAGLDRLMLLRQKSSLHLQMVVLCDKIDRMRVPGLAATAAQLCLASFHRIFRWKFFSWKTLLLSIAVSWVVTSASYLAGRSLEEDTVDLSFDTLPFYPLYVVNYVRDLLTVCIGVACLKVIGRGRVISTIGAVLLNVFSAAAVAYMTLLACDNLDDRAIYGRWPGADRFLLIPMVDTQLNRLESVMGNGPYVTDLEETRGTFKPPSLAEVLRSVARDPWQLVRDPFTMGFGSFTGQGTITITDKNNVPHKVAINLGHYGGGWTLLVVAMSTLAPTLLYGILFLWMCIAKGVLYFGRVTALHLLEVGTEKDPGRDEKGFMPFTMFATAMTILAGIIKIGFALGQIGP